MMLIKVADDYMMWDLHFVITARKYKKTEGRLNLLCVILKAKLLTMTVFITAQAIIVFGLHVLLTPFHQ